MKKIILNLLALLLLFNTKILSQNKKDNYNTKHWRYEIEGVGEGSEGTYLVKIWSYSRKPNIAIEQAKKNAVHAIIFQGYVGNFRIASQPPLVKDPGIEDSKSDFFDPFFENGGYYMKYVSISNDGSISAEDRIKIDKEYKIGVIVSVRKDLLRKDLENAGIIKSLSSGLLNRP
jgi:hypothetical protein